MRTKVTITFIALEKQAQAPFPTPLSTSHIHWQILFSQVDLRLAVTSWLLPTLWLPSWMCKHCDSRMHQISCYFL